MQYMHTCTAKNELTIGSQGNFSSLPTNPRDWIVMDALPEELNHWQVSALCIIGDKSVLQDIPEDHDPVPWVGPNCIQLCL